MGNFPLQHVEDHVDRLPRTWVKRGGVFMPMYQSEALWLNFSDRGYPIALQIAAGKINAVNGEAWQEEMQFEPQGYVVTTAQPWLDGFCVEKGRVRQFVAEPLGQGFTVEEQLTGEAEFGGIQVKAWPLKASVYERMHREEPMFCAFSACSDAICEEESSSMGLGMGGSMKQEIYDDEFRPDDWETGFSSRCFIHLVNSTAYAGITGRLPPHRPYEAADYARAGLPWFDWYSDRNALDGSKAFAGLKTWKEFKEAYEESMTPDDIKAVHRLGKHPVQGRLVS
jgi:hypothetical protein